jgi:hypothetical protein
MCSFVYPAGGNPDSNTLISDMTTVICLDDYHCLDRKGRAEKGVTALAPEAQNFDLMYEQVCSSDLEQEAQNSKQHLRDFTAANCNRHPLQRSSIGAVNYLADKMLTLRCLEAEHQGL